MSRGCPHALTCAGAPDSVVRERVAAPCAGCRRVTAVTAVSPPSGDAIRDGKAVESGGVTDVTALANINICDGQLPPEAGETGSVGADLSGTGDIGDVPREQRVTAEHRVTAGRCRGGDGGDGGAPIPKAVADWLVDHLGRHYVVRQALSEDIQAKARGHLAVRGALAPDTLTSRWEAYQEALDLVAWTARDFMDCRTHAAGCTLTLALQIAERIRRELGGEVR